MFLYEGRKVLFRFSLAVLKLYERRILSMFDPVTIFQFIKEVVKHIFNVEELFRVREGGRGRGREKNVMYKRQDFQMNVILSLIM